MSDISNMLDELEAIVKDPSHGLPEDIFLFISRVTPLINVDLLIRNEQGHTLLTWRDDIYHSSGWHVPGGIIRFRETISDRIRAVAQTELGTTVKFADTPLAINEVIHPSRLERGHFISLLYGCTLLKPPDEKRRFEKDSPKIGEWAWHEKCPGNIISVHEMYRDFI
ncbi:MAG: NUDIX domain-containing protein [Desulfuromonadales bacterium]